MPKEAKQVPVYLFLGLLESGKTSVIKDFLSSNKFSGRDKNLIILCEEGEEELPGALIKRSRAVTEVIEEPEDFTAEKLTALNEQHKPTAVIMEYNGMWMLDRFYGEMPPNWIVYQEMCLADATVFLTYNANMRNLVFDKLKSVETIVFRNFTRDMDKMEYHKIVRAASRRAEIIYEYGENDIEFDDIEDPLPFDLDAPVIEIEDRDYALWYRDITEEEPKYYDKTIRVKGRSLLGGGLADDEFVIGRHIMTCCVEDIQFGGLVAKYDKAQSLDHGGWVIMTATIRKEYNKMYESEGPVFHVLELEKCEPLEDEVATFF